MTQTQGKDFKEKRKRNIIKPKNIAKTLTFRLSILKRSMPINLIKFGNKLSIITVVKKYIMPKIISSPKLFQAQNYSKLKINTFADN